MDPTHIALVAQKDAIDAKHTAEKAVMQVTSHEQICSERYASINSQLAESRTLHKEAAASAKESFDKIYETLDALKSTASKASGIDAAFRYACLIIGVAGAIYGMK